MQKMDGATTYEEWLKAASALDELEGADNWKHKDESSYYDSELIRQRLQEMQRVGFLTPFGHSPMPALRISDVVIILWLCNDQKYRPKDAPFLRVFCGV